MYFLKKYKRGILNKYHKKMPLFERFTKDVSEGFLFIKNLVRNGFKSKTLLCHPHFPSRGATLYKMAKHLGYNITNRPNRNFQTAVYWEYLTHRVEFQYLEKIAGKTQVINLHSRDISKQKVDDVHLEVFGYNTQIDPTSFTGKAVRKSDINAIHNYEVIECPIEKTAEGAFYQILINNEVEGDKVEDIRVPIIKGTLPTVYLKHRALNDRFKNPIYTKITPIEDLLSSEEIENINLFAAKMNLELGEMDILRNRDDGKIYIIDVNNTPQGPPSGISKEEGKQSIAQLAQAFEERFLRSS